MCIYAYFCFFLYTSHILVTSPSSITLIFFLEFSVTTPCGLNEKRLLFDAAMKMEEDPPNSVYRNWFQTTPCGCNQKLRSWAMERWSSMRRLGTSWKDERKQTNRWSVEITRCCQNQGVEWGLGISLEATCLLIKWQPAYRWHEIKIGFIAEQRNLNHYDKENDKCVKARGEIPMHDSGAELLVVVLKRL